MNATVLKIRTALFIILLSGFNFASSSLLAQQTEDSLKNADNEKFNNYKLSLSTGNNITKNGHKMSKNSFYLKPAFEYSNDLGLYTGFYMVYLPTAQKKPIDNISLNLGYDKEFGEHLTLGLDYTYSHFFSTNQINSGNPHTVILEASWDNDLITPSLSYINDFGNNTDYSFSADLSHIFIINEIFTKDDKLIVPVIIGAYFGTSNAYINYLKKNKIKDKKGNEINTSTLNSKFGLTSTFITASVKYRIGIFGLGISGSYDFQASKQIKLTSFSTPIISANAALYF